MRRSPPLESSDSQTKPTTDRHDFEARLAGESLRAFLGDGQQSLECVPFCARAGHLRTWLIGATGGGSASCTNKMTSTEARIVATPKDSRSSVSPPWAGCSRVAGDLQEAEEIVHEAFAWASTRWSRVRA